MEIENIDIWLKVAGKLEAFYIDRQNEEWNKNVEKRCLGKIILKH